MTRPEIEQKINRLRKEKEFREKCRVFHICPECGEDLVMRKTIDAPGPFPEFIEYTCKCGFIE